MIKADARLADGRVPTPAEIAASDVAVGELRGEDVLDVAVGPFAFDERVTHEHNAVAVTQIEDVGVLRGRANWSETGDVRGDKQRKGKAWDVHGMIAAAFDR